MEITSVKVKIIERENSRMRGVAVVVLDDAFVIRDLRIIEGENGMFIAMPSVKLANGEFRDTCHPINPETRKMFEEAILAEYEIQKNEIQ